MTNRIVSMWIGKLYIEREKRLLDVDEETKALRRRVFLKARKVLGAMGYPDDGIYGLRMELWRRYKVMRLRELTRAQLWSIYEWLIDLENANISSKGGTGYDR